MFSFLTLSGNSSMLVKIIFSSGWLTRNATAQVAFLPYDFSSIFATSSTLLMLRYMAIDVLWPASDSSGFQRFRLRHRCSAGHTR